MGYQAPSAGALYRYAFRLDNDRSLTDRFGFSIVFVNDTSQLSREFLQKYCLDLCFRTADRIRFIFFSELPADLLEDVGSDLDTGRAQGGFLKNVLGFFGRGRQPNFEGDPWRTLRPPALRPLRTVGDISSVGHFECVLYGDARSRYGDAVCAAARDRALRAVLRDLYGYWRSSRRCLPIAGLEVDRVYRHVRSWIDDSMRTIEPQSTSGTRSNARLRPSLPRLIRALEDRPVAKHLIESWRTLSAFGADPRR